MLQALINDGRLDALEHVTVGIDAALAAIEAKIDDVDGYDGIRAREDAEPLLGLGLVAFQTYGVATMADLKRSILRSGKAKPKEGFEEECYALDQFEVRGPNVKGRVKGMQLIHHAANYFKHHDQWDQWPPAHKGGAKTAELLRRVGIKKETEFPCIEAVELLCGTSWKMFGLHARAKQWRADVFSNFQ